MRAKQQIQQEVERVLEYSQEYPFKTNAAQLVKEWYKAKKSYIDLFHGETRASFDEEIVITLSEQERKKHFKRFCCELDLKDFFLDYKGLSDFLKQNEEGFFENRVVTPMPALKIAKGTKLLKCFKYFIPDFERCRAAQDIASRYIQDIKIKGYLYLSVDPLDYLTISENNNEWRSCHALDGEYRAGNLNYMMDDTTLVAYLCDQKETKLRCMPEGMKWNSKKWRMLIHTNQFQSVVYYSRQYPFHNSDLLEHTWNLIDAVRDINTRCEEGFLPPETDHSTKTIKVNSIEPWEYELDFSFIMGERACLYDTRDIVDDEGANGYVDLCYSTCYTPIYSLRRDAYHRYRDICYKSNEKKDWDKAFHNEFDITIGKKCKCVKCGGADIERSDSFLCDSCIANEDLDEDAYFTCACCGRRLYDGDETFLTTDGWVCETCHDALQSEDDEREEEISVIPSTEFTYRDLFFEGGV